MPDAAHPRATDRPRSNAADRTAVDRAAVPNTAADRADTANTAHRTNARADILLGVREHRARTALVAVLAVLLAMLVPFAIAPARAHAADHDPDGSLDSVSVVASGLVEIYGWAADADAPTAPVRVEFHDNGDYRIATMARVARPDVAAAYPSYGPNHGFRYDLALADGPHSICVEATNVGAGDDVELGCQNVTVRNNPVATAAVATVKANTATLTGTASDPNSTGPVIVRAYRDGVYAGGVATNANHAFAIAIPVAEGSHAVCLYALNIGAGATTRFGCQTVVVHNNPFGALESAGQVPTGVKVTGWAIDLNTTGAILVRAYVDGRHVADQIATTPRGDIAARYPASGPNHGYSFLLPVTEGSHRICVAASNIGPGVSGQLGCQIVVVHNNPVGALEKAVQVPGGILVSGYAIDFNSTKPATVRVYGDGVYKAGALAATARADVAKRYPTAGANHGYSIKVPFTGGSHLLCVYALNVGAGANTKFTCQRVVMQDNPVGKLETALQYPGGVTVAGWALDPDVTSSIGVRVYVDAHPAVNGTANGKRTDLAAGYPYAGTAHGYKVFIPLTPGNHTVCVYGLNAGAGSSTRLKCVAVSRLVNPVGASSGIARVGVSNTVAVSGWAVDPDSTGAARIAVTVDGAVRQTLTANLVNSAAVARFPYYGSGHGFSANVALDAGEHVVCTVARNTGPGADLRLACIRILTSGEAAPAVPTALVAWPGSKQVTLSWTAPRSTHAAVSGYLLTVNPGNHTVPVPGAVTSVVASKLTNGTHYSFVLRARNALGTGSAASTSSIPTNIPPQTTPAPVATSHYVRNLTGNLSSDASLMRATGASDAAHNPSGHSYLVLLQIGGQDEADHGALLSATARYVSYSAVVSGMKAYLDGYASRQQPYAPVTLAIGTNNDVDVDYSAGASWARNIVNPIAAYAASRHPGMIIAGANDMEPGFSASVSATRAWLSGYLGATSSRFVFNGSADGCSTGYPGGRCNNGWSMSDLQWLAGGAAPSRTISLPQIYNHAMPLQWKYISLTGTNAGRARINFGGPLTEYTACAQAGSCGSIGNVDAWRQLWAAISSSAATRQSQLPNGTDLRIN